MVEAFLCGYFGCYIVSTIIGILIFIKIMTNYGLSTINLTDFFFSIELSSVEKDFKSYPSQT